jgi:hypothetical protein
MLSGTWRSHRGSRLCDKLWIGLRVGGLDARSVVQPVPNRAYLLTSRIVASRHARQWTGMSQQTDSIT